MMKQQEILKKIGVILKELDEQYNYIEQTPGVINDLELELFVANGHFLSDHIEILRKLNSNAARLEAEVKQAAAPPYFTAAAAYTPPPAAPVNFDLPVVQYTPAPPMAEVTEPAEETYTFPDLTPKALPAPEPEEEAMAIKYELDVDDLPDEENEYEEEDDEDPIYDEIQEVETPQPPVGRSYHFSQPLIPSPPPEPETAFTPEPVYTPYVAPEPEYTPYVAPEPEYTPYVAPEPEYTPYVAPEPEYTPYVAPEPVYVAPETAAVLKPITEPEQKLTVNQMLSAQMAGNRVHDQLAPIKDLKSAITLNDKLLYVKDLFNNYSLSYSEAIEILNRYSSFNDADEFLTHNYAKKNNWAEKPATVEKFYALLRRRFV